MRITYGLMHCMELLTKWGIQIFASTMNSCITIYSIAPICWRKYILNKRFVISLQYIDARDGAKPNQKLLVIFIAHWCNKTPFD